MTGNEQFPMTNGERRYAVRQLPRITVDGLPERGSSMLDCVVTTGGSVLFGLAVFFWVRWTTLEREFFANGNGHYLE